MQNSANPPAQGINLTGWIERERDIANVQVPLNEIKVAIARWKEEKQTS